MKIRRLLPSALLLASTLALAGCLGGSTETVPVTGTYELQTVNNQRLPFSYPNGVVVVKEVLSVNLDGSFTDVTSRGDGSTVSDQGSYSNFAGTINFADQTAGIVYQGFVSQQTLTVNFGAYTLVFLRTGPPNQ